MIINHNIASLNTYRQLSSNNLLGSKSLEKLSSGLRINRAGDDAAGLAISEKMRAQIRGLDQASRNSQDAISMVQTAEGALNETHDILQRMRELAVQASNDTNTGIDREEIQKEINQLTSEVNRIANTTEFNTMKLLDGTKAVTGKYSGYIQAAAALQASTQITDVALASISKSAAMTDSIEIHEQTFAHVIGTTGDGNLGTDAWKDYSAAPAEFSYQIVDKSNGTVVFQQTFTNSTDYSGSDIDAFVTDFNTATTNATLSLVDGEFKLAIDNALYRGSRYELQVGGSTIANDMFGANFNMAGGLTTVAGKEANNQIVVTQGSGAVNTLTLNIGTYTRTDFAAELQTRLAAAIAGSTVVFDNVNALQITSGVAGSDGGIVSFTAAPAAPESSSLLQQAGLNSLSVIQAGMDVNNAFTITTEGQALSVTLDNGTYSRSALASHVETQLNAAAAIAGVSDLAVTLTNSGILRITSEKEGLQNGSNQLMFGDTVAGNNAATNSAFNVLGFSAIADVDAADSAIDGIDAGSNGTGTELKMQVGSNNGQMMGITIRDMRALALEITGVAAGSHTVVSGASFTVNIEVNDGTNSTGVSAGIDVSTAARATAAIEVFDLAIKNVSAERSKLGAYQNRLEHTIRNLGTSGENLQAAESRIRDLDMAKEMMTFTKNSILQQAATAMLAQANQAPQGILQLLR